MPTPAIDPASPSPPADAAPRRQLNLFDCTCVIVGIIIGAGLYEATPLVAQAAGGVRILFLVWTLGGLVSLIGAACYAELATTYPREGGEYVFLSRAFGRPMGFLFAWAGFWVVRPGNVGAMAYIFARYAQQLWPLPLKRHALLAYACSAVAILTAVNVVGVRTGKWTQNALTAAKVLGLLAVFGVGLFLVAPAGASAQPSAPAAPLGPSVAGFSLAMVFVLFGYGGWNEMSYVAAEVREPRKNLLRALVLGTAAVAAIYLLGNLAFVRALGFEGVARSRAVAADVLRLRFDRWGVDAISLLICVSCLGAVNGMIFTGSRIYYVIGTDHAGHRALAWVGEWNRRLGTPVRSLVLQAVVTLGLIVWFGVYENGFERLIVFTAPLFWAFFLLTGVALFILRSREPEVARPYRVPLYPATPLLFCLSSAFLLQSSVRYAWANRQREGLWTVAVMSIGIVLAWRQRGEKGRGNIATARSLPIEPSAPPMFENER